MFILVVAAKVYFSLNVPMLVVIGLHLTEHERYNNGFSGQDVPAAIKRDVVFYNSQDAFAQNKVVARQLH
jgi:hypothetical protein